MDHKKLLVVSTSTVHGKGYLEYIQDEIVDFFKGINLVVFIPFARPGGVSWDGYTDTARKKFNELGINLKGIHEFDSIEQGLKEAEGFFTGGGNTFELLSQLYDQGLVEALKKEIASGKPYMGTSAGSNMTGLTIKTTNDMPIVYPPSFDALQFLPFNINPHYLDPDPTSKHMGETRETRIKEFHVYNDSIVVGLREGSWLRLENGKLELKGKLSARIFKQNETPYEEAPGDLSWLLS